MKKVILLVVYAVAWLSNTAMAADFLALTAIQAAPAPIPDRELSEIEAGAICHFQTAGIPGVTVCDAVVAWPLIEVTPSASFTAANGLLVTDGQFLQVTK